MKHSVVTNEWQDATQYKPWNFRTVLLRLDDGNLALGCWNGHSWASPKTLARLSFAHQITHFYIFDRFIDKTKIQEDHE
jgi:hypothetical protein